MSGAPSPRSPAVESVRAKVHRVLQPDNRARPVVLTRQEGRAVIAYIDRLERELAALDVATTTQLAA